MCLPAPRPNVATARSVTLVATTNATPVGLGTYVRGWYCFQVLDAFVTLTERDQRVGLDAGGSLTRSWRLGPASRVFVRVEESSSFDFTCAAVLSTSTVDPTTGLVTTATASPTLTAWWLGDESPSEETRSGVFAAGSGTLVGAPAIDSAGPVYLSCYPPGFSRKAHVIAAQSVICSLVDGPTGTMIGELPAARDHKLEAVDPWALVRLSVAAGSTSAWLSWSDR